jgi:phosphate starvation-inducible PhoH-like protein
MGMVNMSRQIRKQKPSRVIKGKFEEERSPHTALQPKNKMQARYIEAINNFTQTISLGCAGTGKTYIASTMAAHLYMKGTINKIILTRPNVPSSRSLGSFPGTIEEKMAPWTTPVVEVLKNCMGGAYENAVRKGAIIVAPFETMRGSSFSDAFVIMDEAQNTTPEEMKMFTTRIGENCRIVINGDIAQSDIRQTSGLSTIIDLAQRFNLPVPVIEFGIDDVVRSKECKMWIEAFHKSQPKVAL